MLLCFSLCVGLLTPVGSSPALAQKFNQSKPPTSREAKKIIEELPNIDLSIEGDLEKFKAAVDRLDSFHLRKASDLKTWRKAIAKEHSRAGRKLEKKAGSYWFWENPKRGFFIIGGNASKPKGLLISMHGGGAGSGDARSAHSGFSSAAADLGWVSISPEVLEKTERGWTDSGTEEWVLSLVDAALRTWKIDPDQVYFAGHSMGGYGSWTLGAHHADRVAALAPSAGAPTPVYDFNEKLIDIDTGVVPNLRNVPMVVYQSIDDPRVPPDANQGAVERIKRAKEDWGGFENFTYWEVDGRAHNYPEGGMLALLGKIKDFRRNVIQEKLVWQPTLTWKHQFYWLWWDKPVANSVVIAQLDRASNTISLESKADLSGMEILLDERMIDMKSEVILKLNGEEVLRSIPAPSLGSLYLSSLHPDPKLQFIARLRVPKQ